MIHRLTALLALLLAAIAPAHAVPGIVRSFVDARYGQVHVRTLAPPPGRATRPPLILLHPSPYSGDFYRAFMAAMAIDRVVIALDTPGFGDSAAPPGPQTLADYTGALIEALDALGYGGSGKGPADMLGYHTGALIAAAIAAERPDLVRRLVLPGMPYFTGDALAAAYRRNVTANAPDAAGKHVAKYWEFVTEQVPNGLPLVRAQEHFADLMQAYPGTTWAYHAVFGADHTAVLRAARAPALLIATSGSLGPETAAAAKVMPGAAFCRLPGLHHAIFDLAVPELARVTRAYLDGAAPAPPAGCER